VKRLVYPELLDSLPPADPRAIHSRRDLRRINWWMGNPGLLAQALINNLAAPPGQLIELGAGDGSLLLRVAQRLAPLWPEVSAMLLDLQKNVSADTLASFAQLGWRAEAVVADVFDWSPAAGSDPVVLANLFLHHFEEAQLSGLLRKVVQNSNLFIAVEPRRFPRPSLVAPLLGLIGCNDVTRHDAVVSIRAGFTGKEISALWPDQKNWQLTERRAGLFSHLFIARRRV